MPIVVKEKRSFKTICQKLVFGKAIIGYCLGNHDNIYVEQASGE